MVIVETNESKTAGGVAGSISKPAPLLIAVVVEVISGASVVGGSVVAGSSVVEGAWLTVVSVSASVVPAFSSCSGAEDSSALSPHAVSATVSKTSGMMRRIGVYLSDAHLGHRPKGTES